MGTVMIQQTSTKYKLRTAENIKKKFPHGAFMSKNMGNCTGLCTIFKLIFHIYLVLLKTCSAGTMTLNQIVHSDLLSCYMQKQTREPVWQLFILLGLRRHHSEI